MMKIPEICSFLMGGDPGGSNRKSGEPHHISSKWTVCVWEVDILLQMLKIDNRYSSCS